MGDQMYYKWLSNFYCLANEHKKLQETRRVIMSVYISKHHLMEIKMIYYNLSKEVYATNDIFQTWESICVMYGKLWFWRRKRCLFFFIRVIIQSGTVDTFLNDTFRHHTSNVFCYIWVFVFLPPYYEKNI
jgi:hypothetical protein